jgi:hypothetical protein
MLTMSAPVVQIPKPKAPTKWEQFAKVKGINKKKRSRMVFDDEAQAWKPRYGYKRIGDAEAEWVMEDKGVGGLPRPRRVVRALDAPVLRRGGQGPVAAGEGRQEGPCVAQ